MKDRIEKRPEIRVVQPGERSGSVAVPSSKSQLHRLLICAALGDAPAEIVCRGIPEDVRATMRCLNALGAKIEEIADGGDSSCKEQLLRVRPMDRSVRCDGAVLDCGGSASTLRFLLPIAGMLGVSCTFMRSGRLPERPLAPYAAQLRANGMYIREEGPLLSVSGRLSGGEYVLPGNISSQFISGLLMAMGGFQGHSRLRVEGAMESTHYVRMTETVLREAGIRFEKEETLSEGGMPVTVWTSEGGQRCRLPGRMHAEGDWSSAAFSLCMGALSEEGICVRGLEPASVQGDRAVLDALRQFGAQVEIRGDSVFVKKGVLKAIELDVSQIPDAVPPLAAVAAFCGGDTRFCRAQRLRLKESDRIRATVSLIRSLGGRAEETPDGLTVSGRPFLEGGTVDPCGDHRIAMAAAAAACGCRGAVAVLQPSCVGKSYPSFWDDLEQLKVTI